MLYTTLISIHTSIWFTSRFRQSDSVYSAAGDLGLHHGLDGLFALACDANGELIKQGHHGVMIEDKSIGDSSAVEAQDLKVFQIRNGRCDAQQESAVIAG